MSTPEIDERFDDLVRELRTLPGAPVELRERIRRLEEMPLPEPRPRMRRLALVGATVALVGVAGVAAVYGLVSSGGGTGQQKAAGTVSAGAAGGGGAARRSLTTLPTATVATGDFAAPKASPPVVEEHGAAVAPIAKLPPTQGRLQQYSATMRLRVKGVTGLSRTTNRAMQITRSLGGFVASVDYGTPTRKNGESYLTVRIPNARVQQAIVRFSSLGVILSQEISIRDLQDQANHQAVQIIRLQKAIDRLAAKLRGPLSAEERVRTQSQLDAARAALRARTEQHTATVRQGRLATFRLEFTTRKQAVAPPPPSHQGRIGRAASHAFDLLAKIVAGTIYAAIVLLPLLVVALLAFVASRVIRRRGNERLLARA